MKRVEKEPQYVYGQDDVRKKNPSTIQQPLISESFARHGISVNFEYNENTSITYYSQGTINTQVVSFIYGNTLV